jgi:hypothetical protein
MSKIESLLLTKQILIQQGTFLFHYLIVTNGIDIMGPDISPIRQPVLYHIQRPN